MGGSEGPILLPLFYGLTMEDCNNMFLPYEPNQHVFEDNGFLRHDLQLKRSTVETMEIIRRLASFVGLRNDMMENEWEFAERVANAVYKALKGEPWNW